MPHVQVVSANPFRPHRYPLLRQLVEGKEDSSHSLADMVRETLLKEIVCGELKAGTPLKSTQIAQRLGVSRTPVARALTRLTEDGILVQPNNHFAIVADEAPDSLVQLHEVRELLEPEAAFRSAGRIPEDVIDDLWAVARDAKPTDDYDWTEAAQYLDFGIHLAIAAYCGNLPMKVTIQKCWSYKRVSYQLSEGCRSELESEYEQHVQILTAVSAGDAENARHLMSLHLANASMSRFNNQVV